MAPAPKQLPEPEVISDFTPQDNSKFPWRAWADGKIRVFVRGEHYETATSTFRQNAQKWATRFGYSVKSVSHKEPERIELQFVQAGRDGASRRRRTTT